MSTRIQILKDGVITVVKTANDRQLALNSLVSTMTANRVLRSDGTNLVLGSVNLATDVTGVLPPSNGGFSGSASFVDLTTAQSIGGLKTFSEGLVLPTAAHTTVGSIWRNGNNLEFRNNANTVQIILNSAGNLSNLSDKQLSLNNLVGAVTSGNYLRGNGTNIVLSSIQASDVPTLNQNTTGTASNVTGIVSISNGGTNSNTKVWVDLSTTQTIQGAKTFSGSPINITAATTGTGGTGSVLKVVQTGTWSANLPYVLEVIGYSYLDGFRITGQGGARGIYQIGSGLQLDFATNDGDITFTSGTTGTAERIRIYNTDGRVRVMSTTATTSTTTGALTVAGGAGFNGGICANLPTSSAGLTTGMFWRNGNVVNIV